MSTPVLAYKIDRESRFRGQSKSFLFGGIQFVPTARPIFQTGEILYLSYGLVNLPEDVRRGGSVAYTILKEGVEISPQAPGLSRAPRRSSTSSRSSRSPAIRPRTTSSGSPSSAPTGRERLLNKTHFEHHPARRPAPALGHLPAAGPRDERPDLQHSSGSSISRRTTWPGPGRSSSRPTTASPNRRPSPGTSAGSCSWPRTTRGSRTIAQPYLGDDRRFDFLQMLGDVSRALGEHAEAVAYYKDYLAHFGMNIQVLNGIGHSEMALGNTDGALYAFEKSLELNPKQDDLQALVKSLKEKK